MTPDRCEILEELFHRGVELDPETRRNFIAQSCGSDVKLQRELTALLEADSGEFCPISQAVDAGLQWFVQASPTAEVGELAGAYRLERVLGEGGMGTVWLGERVDGTFERQVAIKLIRASGIAKPVLAERFQEERKIQAALDHPNIARLLDGGITESGQPYLVMEFVEGKPLDRYCQDADLSVERRLGLFSKICRAVQYAHSRLVVHRDLKPSNLLVTAEGVPKLLDFGMAKLVAVEAKGREVTQPAQRLLTPEYASPEAVLGLPMLTAHDVYGLGVLLYELLCSERPFRYDSARPWQLEQQICEKEPVPPSRRGGPISKVSKRAQLELDSIVSKALGKQPEDRYLSAGELAEEVERYLNGFPVEAARPSAANRILKFAGRHRFAVGWAVAGLAVLLAFTATVIVMADRLRVERDAAQAERAAAEQVSRFMIDSFRLADPGEARGNSITVREILEREAQRVGQLNSQPDLYHRMLLALSRAYNGLGLFPQSEALAEQSVQTSRQLKNPAKLAEALAVLGNVKVRRAKLGEAEKVWREAAEIYERNELKQSWPYAQVLAGAASTLRQQSKFQEAETMARRAVDATKGLAPNPGDSSRIRVTLAQVLLDRGRQAEAEPILREALADCRAASGNDHPDCLDALANLGISIYNQGKFDQAEPVYRESLQLLTKVLGPKHAAVANAQNDLAVLMENRGLYSESEKLLREAIATDRLALGDDHVDTSTLKANLAIMLNKRGKLAEALQWAEESWESKRKLLGAENDATLGVEQIVLILRASTGGTANAETRLRHIVATKEVSLGQKHPKMATAYRSLASFLLSQRRYREAEPYFRRAYEIRKKQNARAPFTAREGAWLGQCLLALGRRQEAEALGEEALKTQKDLLAPNALEVANTLDLLGRVSLEQGQVAKAEPLLARAYQIRKDGMVAESPEIAESLRILKSVRQKIAQ